MKISNEVEICTMKIFSSRKFMCYKFCIKLGIYLYDQIMVNVIAYGII